MDDGPNPLDAETTRAALPLHERRDAWLEQRLGYLAGELARLKADLPLRRFLRGAVAAYRRFLFTADLSPPLSVLGDPSGRQRGAGAT